MEHGIDRHSECSDGGNAVASESGGSEQSSPAQSPVHSEEGNDQADRSEDEEERNDNSENNVAAESQTDAEMESDVEEQENEKNEDDNSQESGDEDEDNKDVCDDEAEEHNNSQVSGDEAEEHNNSQISGDEAEVDDSSQVSGDEAEDDNITQDSEDERQDGDNKQDSEDERQDDDNKQHSDEEPEVDEKEGSADEAEDDAKPESEDNAVIQSADKEGEEESDNEDLKRENNGGAEDSDEEAMENDQAESRDRDEAVNNEENMDEDNEKPSSPRSECGEVPEINIESDDESESHSLMNDERTAEERDAEVNDTQGKSDDEDDKDAPMSPDVSSDSSDDEENKAAGHRSPTVKKRKARRNSEGSDVEKQDVGDVIANIFGLSDEEEEFEGFDQKDIDDVRRKRETFLKSNKVVSGSEESEGEKSGDEGKSGAEGRSKAIKDDEEKEDGAEKEQEQRQDSTAVSALPVSDDESDEDGNRHHDMAVSDFDVMMQKKKEESSRRRKRKDVDIINDSDDLIAEIITQMRHAADEDRQLNIVKKTATKKLKILPLVLSQLKKQDLKIPFLDQGILNVMADWMAPLPDKSLPNLQIREGMFRQLEEFPAIDQSFLKSSGVGRALMYLYKHPKETKENKDRAGRLIKQWARPIFNVTTDYHSLTKEEREQRDFDHVPKKQKLQKSDNTQEQKTDIDKAMIDSDAKGLRPGDKGWIGRARVPAPSTRDYVVRPKWNVELEFGRGSSKKPMNRFERHMRTLQEKKRMSKGQRAVPISIEGRKMAI